MDDGSGSRQGRTCRRSTKRFGRHGLACSFSSTPIEVSYLFSTPPTMQVLSLCISQSVFKTDAHGQKQKAVRACPGMEPEHFYQLYENLPAEVLDLDHGALQSAQAARPVDAVRKIDASGGVKRRTTALNEQHKMMVQAIFHRFCAKPGRNQHASVRLSYTARPLVCLCLHRCGTW